MGRAVVDRAGERVHTRACRFCRGAFTPTRPHHVFCRDACRFAGRYASRPEPPLPVEDLADWFARPFE
jgi:hypothetical protein